MRFPRWLSQLSSGFGLDKALAPLATGVRAAWKAGPLKVFRQLGEVIARAFLSVVRWCAGLNLRLLLQGLPALLCGAGSLTILAIAFFTPVQDVEARYWEQAKSAAKGKDFSEALACYERLAALQSDRADVVFEMALVAEAAGQPERCSNLMTQLAPAEKQGYGKAHFWQAVRLFTAANQTQQMRQLCETHLLRAVEAGVEDKEAAHGLLGDVYLSKGRLAEAEPHLLIAVKTKPQVRLRLAHLYAAQGNVTRAKTEAQMAINLYSTAAKSDLFAHYARVKWAEATAFLEQFPQAISILEEGLTGTGEQLYRVAIARTYATWFDHLGLKANVAERLALLERGLQFDPRNITLLDRMLAVTGLKSPALAPTSAAAAVGAGAIPPAWMLVASLSASNVAESSAARTALRRLLAKGQATPQAHFVLGLDAWERGQADEARLHWERAHELAPDLPVIANNLAWLLYQTAPAELPKALDLVNLAIDKAPREIDFRDTRGHILLKMGKHREALPDLEAVLPNSPNQPALHRALADVYAKLGSHTLAEEHRQLALEKGRKAERRP